MKRDRQGARHRRLRDAAREANVTDRRPFWQREGWPVCTVCRSAPLKIHSGTGNVGNFICVRGHEYVGLITATPAGRGAKGSALPAPHS